MSKPLHLVCVCGGRDANPVIMNHFIRHYCHGVGVNLFHMYVHDNPEFERNIRHFGIAYETIPEFSEQIKNDLFNKVIMENPTEWVLTCDMDEFHDYGGPFHWFIKDKGDIDSVWGVLVDRFAREGFPPLPNENLAEAFPLCTDFSMNMLSAYDGKIAAVRGQPIRAGHHSCMNKNREYGPIRVNHYKWDASIIARMQRERGNETSNNEARTFRFLYDGGHIERAVKLCTRYIDAPKSMLNMIGRAHV